LKALRAYAWSSYRAYAGYERKPDWLTDDRAAGGHGPKACRSNTERALLLGAEESLWGRFRQTVAVGSEAFAEQVRRAARGKTVREWSGRGKLAEPAKWEAVVAAVEREFGMPWRSVCEAYGNGGRELAFRLGHRLCGLTLRELGSRAGGVDYSAVSVALRIFGRKMEKDRVLRKLCRRVEEELSGASPA